MLAKKKNYLTEKKTTGTVKLHLSVEVIHVHVKYLIMNYFLQPCFTRTCQMLFILQNINTCFPMIGHEYHNMYNDCMVNM